MSGKESDGKKEEASSDASSSDGDGFAPKKKQSAAAKKAAAKKAKQAAAKEAKEEAAAVAAAVAALKAEKAAEIAAKREAIKAEVAERQDEQATGARSRRVFFSTNEQKLLLGGCLRAMEERKKTQKMRWAQLYGWERPDGSPGLSKNARSTVDLKDQMRHLRVAYEKGALPAGLLKYHDTVMHVLRWIFVGKTIDAYEAQ